MPGNERCDEIATAFASKKNIKLYDGPLSDYKIDIKSIAHDSEKKSARSASKKRSSVKAYSYISKVGGKIAVDKSWQECEKRVKGVSGARYKKSLNKSEEISIIEEFSK